MTVKLDLVGIVVEDMARSLAFYRRLGLELPVELDGEPHAEVTLPSGVRLAWDTEESLERFVPDYQAPMPGAQRIGIAFLADSPAEVDALYDEPISFGYEGEQEVQAAHYQQPSSKSLRETHFISTCAKRNATQTLQFCLAGVFVRRMLVPLKAE